MEFDGPFAALPTVMNGNGASSNVPVCNGTPGSRGIGGRDHPILVLLRR